MHLSSPLIVRNLRQITVNDLPVGRSVDETIRLVKAFQFTVYLDSTSHYRILICVLSVQDKHGEVCPANWTEGSKTMKPDPKGSLEYFSSVAAPKGTNGVKNGTTNCETNGSAKKRPRVDSTSL